VGQAFSPNQQAERTIAFEAYLTGQSKELRGIAKDIEFFDHVIVCSPSAAALDALKSQATRALGEGILDKVTFNPISQYLIPSPKPSYSRSVHWNQNHKPSLDKSDSGSEPGRRSPPASRRGRKRKTPLMDKVAQAYAHLHDLDYLQDCPLSKLPEVTDEVQIHQIMPEAQALRRLLTEAAEQVVRDVESVPSLSNVRQFLTRYVDGKKIAEIAEELRVSREWVSRAYRKEAFGMAGAQFVRLVSKGDTPER